MRVPQSIGHDLDETTQLYVDVHIALDLLHMPYPEYMTKTTALERQLYQLYIALKNQKEEHAHWHAENDAKAKQNARDAIGAETRP